MADASLLPAHYGHGDTKGECPPEPVCDYPKGNVCVCESACIDDDSNSASATGKANKNDAATKKDSVETVEVSCTCIDGKTGAMYLSDGDGDLSLISNTTTTDGSFREITGQ